MEKKRELLLYDFNAPDDLPKTVGRTLNQGSSPMSMDFHPVQQTLLLVVWMMHESCSMKCLKESILECYDYRLCTRCRAHGSYLPQNCRFFVAVQALEETSASEGILQCLSVFAEICESAQQDCTNPLVEPFLNLYQNIQKAAETINSLLDTMSEDRSGNLLDTSNTFKNKKAALWVQAAIGTDLSQFSLFSKEDKNDLRNGNNTHFVVLQNTPKAHKDSNLLENKQLKGHNGPKTVPLMQL